MDGSPLPDWPTVAALSANHLAALIPPPGLTVLAIARDDDEAAAKWAEHRSVVQVVFKPDWTRHQQAAPFKRNDQMLEAQPIGVVAAPGSGVTDNLVDKARRQGIPVFRLGEGGA